jgi:peptide/nickel transport system permease protein
MSQPTPQDELLAEHAALGRRAAAGEAPAEPGVRGLSQGRLVARRFLRHPGALAGMAVLAAVVLLAFTSVGWGPFPGWWRYGHAEIAPLTHDGAPTLSLVPPAAGEHPFGQDRIGRDLFAMTMRGAQQSITVMAVIGIVAGAIGVLVGALAGYFGGWVDALLMRLTDVVIIIPALLLAAVLSAFAGRRDTGGWFGRFAADHGVLVLGAFLGLVLWVGLARLVRAEFLTLREREFVDAARLSGASDLRIIATHLVPNAIGVITVNVTLTMSAAILLETALSYLGVGVRAPDTSLGLLVAQNQEAFSTRPWLFWWPGAFIVLISLSINLIGDGLRDAFDPRRARRTKHRSAR